MGPRRLLVVDGYDPVRSALHALLSSEGFDVKSACDVGTALSVTSEWRPEIILFDPGLLPDIQDAHDLREGLAPRGLLITMTTMDTPVALKWLELEDLRFRKPFDVSLLFAVVDDWFSQRR